MLKLDLPLDFGMTLAQVFTTARSSLGQTASRHRLEGGPPENLTVGMFQYGSKRRRAIASNSATALSGNGPRGWAFTKAASESCTRFPRSAASIGRSISSSWRSASTCGIEAVGVGDPVIDFSCRKLPWPRVHRRCRLRSLTRHHARNRRQGRELSRTRRPSSTAPQYQAPREQHVVSAASDLVLSLHPHSEAPL